MADDLQTTAKPVLVFRCDFIRAKLPLAQCVSNWNISNGNADPNAPRNGSGRGAKRLPIAQCTDCPRGKEHAETGKFQNGLRTEVLTVGAAAAPPVTKVPMVVKTPIEIAAARVKELYDNLGGFNAYKKKEDRLLLRELIEAFCILAAPHELARLTGIPLHNIREWRRLDGEAPEEPTAALNSHPEVVALRQTIAGVRALHSGKELVFPEAVRAEVRRLLPLFPSQSMFADAIGLLQPQVSKMCPELPADPEKADACRKAAEVIWKYAADTTGNGHRTSDQQNYLRKLVNDFAANHGTLVLLASLTEISTTTIQRWATMRTRDEKDADAVEHLAKIPEVVDIRRMVDKVRADYGTSMPRYPRELRERVVNARFAHFPSSLDAARAFGLSASTIGYWITEHSNNVAREAAREKLAPVKDEPRCEIEEAVERAEGHLEDMDALLESERPSAPDPVGADGASGADEEEELNTFVEEPEELVESRAQKTVLLPEAPGAPSGAEVPSLGGFGEKFDALMRSAAPKMVGHSFMIRRGFTAELLLPSDITQKEAERLKAFIDLLVF